MPRWRDGPYGRQEDSLWIVVVRVEVGEEVMSEAVMAENVAMRR